MSDEFREKLKSIYKSKDKIVSLIHGLDDFREQSIKDYYVHLRHIMTDENGGRKTGNIMTEDSNDIEVDNMFTDCRGNQNGNKFLILGVAGVGKSTLMQYMAYKWSCNENWDRFDYVYKVNLKLLLKKEWKYNYDRNDLNDILKCFVHYNLRDLIKSENMESDIFPLKMLEWPVNKEKVLLMVDGYDEVVHLKEDDEFKLLQKKWFGYNNLILTSRHEAVDADIKNSFDLVIENVGFDKNGIEQYISKYSFHQNQIKDKLKSFIKSNPVVEGICNIPVNAALLCFIFDNSKSMDQISNVSDLYSEIVRVLSFRYFQKYKYKENHRKINLNEKYKQGEMILEELKVLQYLAYKGMTGGGIEIEDENRNITYDFKGFEKIQDNRNITIQGAINDLEKNVISYKMCVSNISNFGLLKFGGYIEGEIENRYFSFIHLTFQEYLTARFLFDKLKTEKNAENLKCIWRFIAEYRYEPRYLMVLKFLAGMIASDEEKITNHLSFICLTKPFWESVCCNIDGELELGVEKKVNLFLHLLSQSFNKSGELSDRIPFKELLQVFIDAVVISDLLGFGMELKQSHYMSKNIKKALLSGMANGELILTNYITEETQRNSTTELKSILDILQKNQFKAEKDFLKSGCIEIAVGVVENFSTDEQANIIDTLLIIMEKSNDKWQLLKITIDGLKSIAKKVIMSVETSQRIFEVIKPYVKNPNYSNAALKCIFEAATSAANSAADRANSQSLLKKVSEFFMLSFELSVIDLKLAFRMTHHLINQINDGNFDPKPVIQKLLDRLSYKTPIIMEQVLSSLVKLIHFINNEKVKKNIIESYVDIFSNETLIIRLLAVTNIEKLLVSKNIQDFELVKNVINGLKSLFKDEESYVRRAAMRAAFNVVKHIEDGKYREVYLSELLNKFTEKDVYARNKSIKGAIGLIEGMENCESFQTKFIENLNVMLLNVIKEVAGEQTKERLDPEKDKKSIQSDFECSNIIGKVDSEDVILFVNFKSEVDRLTNYEFDISVYFAVHHGIKLINNDKEESVKFIETVESYLTNKNWKYRYFSAVLSFELIKNINNDLVLTLSTKLINLSNDQNEMVKAIVEKGIAELMKISENEEFISAAVEILFKNLVRNETRDLPTFAYDVLKEIKNDNIAQIFLKSYFTHFEQGAIDLKNESLRGLCELIKGLTDIILFEDFAQKFITLFSKDGNMEVRKTTIRLTADLVTNKVANNSLKNPDYDSRCDELSLSIINIYKQCLKDEKKEIRIEIAENTHRLATSTYYVNIIENIIEVYCKLLIDKDCDVIKKALENIIKLKDVLKTQKKEEIVKRKIDMLYRGLADLLKDEDCYVKILAAETTTRLVETITDEEPLNDLLMKNIMLLADKSIDVKNFAAKNVALLIPHIKDNHLRQLLVENLLKHFDVKKTDCRSISCDNVLKKIKTHNNVQNKYPENNFFEAVEAINAAEQIKESLKLIIDQIQASDKKTLNIEELLEDAEALISCVDKDYTEYILEKKYFQIFVDKQPENARKKEMKENFDVDLMNKLESVAKKMDDDVIVKIITKFAELFDDESKQVRKLSFGQFDILIERFDLETAKIINTFKDLGIVKKIKKLYDIEFERRVSALFKLIMNIKDESLAECIVKFFFKGISTNSKSIAIYEIFENAFKVSFVLLPSFSNYLSHENNDVREKSVSGLVIWFQILCNRFQALGNLDEGQLAKYTFDNVKKSFINLEDFKMPKTDLTVNKSILKALNLYYNFKEDTEMEIKEILSQFSNSNEETKIKKFKSLKEIILSGFNKIGHFQGYKIIEMALMTLDSMSSSDEDSNFEKLFELSRKILSFEFDVINEEGLKWIDENFDKLVTLSKESKVFIKLLYQNLLKNLELNDLKERLLKKCINQGTTLTLTSKGDVKSDGKRYNVKLGNKELEKIASAILERSVDVLAIQYKENRPLFANSGVDIDIAASDKRTVSILNDDHEIEYNKWKLSLLHYSDDKKIMLRRVFLLLEGRLVFGNVDTYQITSNKTFEVKISDSDSYRNIFGDMGFTDFTPDYYGNSVYINYTDAKSFIEKIKINQNESEEETKTVEFQRNLIVNWLKEEIKWKLPMTWDEYKAHETISNGQRIDCKEKPINCIYKFEKVQLLHINNKVEAELMHYQCDANNEIADLKQNLSDLEKFLSKEIKMLKSDFTDFTKKTPKEQEDLNKEFSEKFIKINESLNILGVSEIQNVNKIFSGLETEILKQFAKQLYCYFKNFFYCFDLLKSGVLEEKSESGFLFGTIVGLTLKIIADICAGLPVIGAVAKVVKFFSKLGYKKVKKKQFKNKQRRINSIIDLCKGQSEETSLGVELSKIAVEIANYRKVDLEKLSTEKFNKRIYKDSKLFMKYLYESDQVAEEMRSSGSLSSICTKNITKILNPPVKKRCASFLKKRV